MPAHMTGTRRSGLKAVTFFPRNEGTDLDSHQGAVLLFEAGRGRLLAVDRRHVGHRACARPPVSGLATRFSPGRTPATSRSWARASRPARTWRRCWPCAGSGAIRVASKTPERARELRRARRPSATSMPSDGLRVGRGGGAEGADIVCTVTSSPRAGASWATGSLRAPTSTPSARASRRPASSTRPRFCASRLFVDHRESALAEAGDLHPDPRRGSGRRRPHPSASSASSSPARSPGRTSPDRRHALQVGRPRDRGRRGRAPHLREGPRTPGSESGWSSAEAATKPIEPPSGSTKSARPARASPAPAVRTPLAPARRRRSPSEIFLKLENLQPIGSFKLRGAGKRDGAWRSPEALARGVWTASAGNMAQGVAWEAPAARHPVHRRRAGARSARPRSPRSSASAAGSSQVPLERWWQVARRASRIPGMDGLFIHPVADRASSPATARSGWRSWRICPTSTRCSCRTAAEVSRAGSPRRSRLSGRATRVWPARSRRPRPSRRRCRGAPREIDSSRRASWTASAARSVLPEMWPTRERAPRRLARRLARRDGRGDPPARGARAGRRGRRGRAFPWPPRCRMSPAERSSASSPAGTSTPRSSRRFSPGGCPDWRRVSETASPRERPSSSARSWATVPALDV